MFILHCQKCHHEWQAVEEDEKCDWCGSDSYTLGKNKSWDWEIILNCLKKMIKNGKNRRK